MTEQELIEGYQTEIAYQKHMLDNLSKWYRLLFALSGIGFVLIYFFLHKNFILLVIGIILAVVGILGMSIFGYGIYKGRINVQKVIDDLEEKLRFAESK